MLGTKKLLLKYEEWMITLHPFQSKKAYENTREILFQTLSQADDYVRGAAGKRTRRCFHLHLERGYSAHLEDELVIESLKKG